MTIWHYNDGGRKEAGFKGDTDDCVTRAIAIATGLTYDEVYRSLNTLSSAARGKASKGRARTGVFRKVYEAYLKTLGWEFVPTMAIGQGCKVHLKADELPSGTIIARLSRHLCVVKEGVIHDTHDPSREGTRCVYGYYRKANPMTKTIEREPIKLSPNLVKTAILMRLRSGDTKDAAEATAEIKSMLGYANDKQGPRGDFSRTDLDYLVRRLQLDKDARPSNQTLVEDAEYTLACLVYYCGGLQGGWFGDKPKAKEEHACNDFDAQECTAKDGGVRCHCPCHSEAGA
jgi:hypothetical protein